jgi:hypothetical protein
VDVSFSWRHLRRAHHALGRVQLDRFDQLAMSLPSDSSIAITGITSVTATSTIESNCLAVMIAEVTRSDRE